MEEPNGNSWEMSVTCAELICICSFILLMAVLTVAVIFGFCGG